MTLPKHKETPLTELGINVDEQLAELITLCWRRCVATAMSCQNSDGLAYIGFTGYGAVYRWGQLIPEHLYYVDEIPDEEVYTDYEIRFHPADIPAIVAALKDLTNPPMWFDDIEAPTS